MNSLNFHVYTGSLLGALHDCELKGYHCPEELKLNISTINELLNDVSEKAIPFVKVRIWSNGPPIL